MEITNQFNIDNYICTEYANGTIVEEWGRLPEPLSENELHKLKIESDLEYIKCLQELQLGI